MEKQANSINPKEREKMQKEFDEVARGIEAQANRMLDRNPDMKKKVMAALFGEPKQNNN